MMRLLLICLLLMGLSHGLAACGKRPKSLAVPEGGSKTSRGYPDPKLEDN